MYGLRATILGFTVYFSLSKQESNKTADLGGHFPENVPVTLTGDEDSRSTIDEEIGGTPTHMPEAEQSSLEEEYTDSDQNYGGLPYATQPSEECVCVCGRGGMKLLITGLTKMTEISYQEQN